MSAAQEVLEAKRLVRSFVGSFRPECWSGPDAATLVGDLTGLSRLVDAAITLAAGRVATTGTWSSAGHRSPEEWLAEISGASRGTAADQLAVARDLHGLERTEQALRAGQLSVPQAGLVVSGAAANPSAEADLLAVAGGGSLRKLRDRARAARAAAAPVDTEAVHRSRFFRSWTAVDGALEGRFRLTPERGAQLLAGLEPFRREAFEAARAAGIREDPAAYAADGLVVMAGVASAAASDPGRGSRTAGGVDVHVRVDRSALLRGRILPGETCEIDGVGPVPVAVAQSLLGDARIWAVLNEGPAVRDVRVLGRSLPARLKVALIERDRCCVVPGCDATSRLENHHLVPFAEGGEGSLDNLARICPYHHDLITHRGARLDGPWPHWSWIPPPIGPDGEEGGPGPFDDPPFAPASSTDPAGAGTSPPVPDAATAPAGLDTS